MKITMFIGPQGDELQTIIEASTKPGLDSIEVEVSEGEYFEYRRIQEEFAKLQDQLWKKYYHEKKLQNQKQC